MAKSSGSSKCRSSSLLFGLLATTIFPIAGCGSSSPSPDLGDPPDGISIPPVEEPEPPAATAPDPTTPPATAPDPTTPPIDPAALPAITSGDGITVESVTGVSPRTFDIKLSTANVSPDVKMKQGNAVRITLPPDYATSGKRYPVLYFLHGATCDYTTVSTAIDIEAKTEESDVIVVMPEGGVMGLYTDWVDQSPTQKWATYHLTELLPFLDRNLRTLATKEGRGVLGFSMGGLGAMKYASERPDLFGAAASFSGVVDLQHLAFQLGLVVSLQQNGMNPAGPFGDLLNPMWGKANPAAHAAQLATVKSFIYVGQGNDPVEAVCTSQGYVLSTRLDEANIPHFFMNYGAPGQTPEGNCDGTHSLTCARYAFADALPRLMEVLADPQ